MSEEPEKRVRKSGYRPWAELLARTFALDVAQGQAPRFSPCPSCHGRMRLLAVVKNPLSIARYPAAAGELTDSAHAILVTGWRVDLARRVSGRK